ncbi:hypothetical protein LSAT2_000512 [Lamellibrachia satsuma]|nr:hypothetical protein LSAT2_000512 [Lamellibrachia satsuma]
MFVLLQELAKAWEIQCLPTFMFVLLQELADEWEIQCLPTFMFVLLQELAEEWEIQCVPTFMFVLLQELAEEWEIQCVPTFMFVFVAGAGGGVGDSVYADLHVHQERGEDRRDGRSEQGEATRTADEAQMTNVTYKAS